jgi:carboxylesterase
VTLNSLLKKLGQGRESWEYVVNEPENRHINYERNPLKGINELVQIMNVTEDCLASVKVPTLVIQASKDPIVDPESGHQIFEQISSPYKELIMLERSRHGIVNGEGCDDVFSHVHHFLGRAPAHGIMVSATAELAGKLG